MNRRLVFWVNLAIGAAVLAVMLAFSGGDAFALLSNHYSGPLLLLSVGVVAASIASLSWRWGYLLRGLSRSPSLLVLTLQRSAAHSLAVLVPSAKLGGDPLRAWLANRSGVASGDAIASVVVDRTLEVGAAAPFSIVFATLLLQAGVPQLGQALMTVAIATVGLCIGVAIAVRRLRTGAGLVTALVRATGADRFRVIGSRLGVIERAESASAALVEQPRKLAFAFLASLGSNVLVLVEFVCLFHAFGLPLTVPAVVGAVFVTGAAHMLPIPGSLGVLEGAQVWLFAVLGYPTEVGLAVGLVVRLRELLWMAPGLAYLGSSLSGSFSKLRTASLGAEAHTEDPHRSTHANE